MPRPSDSLAIVSRFRVKPFDPAHTTLSALLDATLEVDGHAVGWKVLGFDEDDLKVSVMLYMRRHRVARWVIPHNNKRARTFSTLVSQVQVALMRLFRYIHLIVISVSTCEHTP